jgi:hypothetical protein
MRRLIAIFLIVSLPVHGWAVGLMGMSMTVQQLTVQVTPAGESALANTAGALDVPGQAAMPPDCPLLAMTKAESRAGGSGHDDAQEPVSLLCQGCTACQLCMAVACGPSMALCAAESLRHSRPVKGDPGFASASLPGWFKPPIG